MAKVKVQYDKDMQKLIKKFGDSPERTAKALTELIDTMFSKPLVISRQTVGGIASGKTGKVEHRVKEAMEKLL